MNILKSLSIIIFISFFVIGCGSISDSTENIYTIVSGTVLDADGNPVEGAEVIITSNPVTVYTNGDGYFSVKVEIGNHELVIKYDSDIIYSDNFTCRENELYPFSNIITSYSSVPNTNNDIRKLISSITFNDNNLKACVAASGANYIDELRSLYCLSWGIKDLTGINWLSSLTNVQMGANDISDISPLASLTSLLYLGLHNNNISDVSALASLTNLTFLGMSYNRINDISSLASLNRLATLKLDNNRISDISALESLTSVTLMKLHKNNISDVSALASLTNLDYVTLNDNIISDISPLASLNSIYILELRNNNISDVSAFASLTSIAILGLDRNNISNVSDLASLTNLTNLKLASNNITTGVSNLVSLVNTTEIILYGSINIPCADLKVLKDALGDEVVKEPNSCL